MDLSRLIDLVNNELILYKLNVCGPRGNELIE